MSSVLDARFADPVAESQQAFRALMDACPPPRVYQLPWDWRRAIMVS